MSNPGVVLQSVQFLDKYAREKKRGGRESWYDAIDRVMSYFYNLTVAYGRSGLDYEDWDKIHQAMAKKQAMPSMRALAMAGAAAERHSMTIYNCTYAPVIDLDVFREAVIILMNGAGFGYSVERKYIDRLPRVGLQLSNTGVPVHSVPDTTEGWAEAIGKGIAYWVAGYDLEFNTSQIRPEGTPLKTKGGIASGPQHLETALYKIRNVILNRQGERLRPLDCHDILCHIADAVVSGGVRRCLPKGTRVHTKRGAIPIEEVVVNDEVMTERGYKRVTGWSDEGKKEIVELVTQAGTLFRCTPDHRIAVLSDIYGGYTFKEAQDITPEDRILFIRHATDGEHHKLLPLPQKRLADRSGSLLVQPVLDEETAWFLGKFFADGYVQTTIHDDRGKGGNTSVMIACHEEETNQIERILSWFYSHGIQVSITSGENKERCTKLRTSNRQIARWLINYKQANTPLIIPEEIWRSPTEIRKSFLAGVIDGDGAVNNRPLLLCSTIYETFVRDLAKLYATLGIITEVKLNRDAIGAWKPLWHLVVKEKESRDRVVQIINEFGCKNSIPKKKQHGYTVPNAMVKRSLRNKDFCRVWTGKGDINAHTLGGITEQDWFVPVVVNGVRHAGTANVYDIEVNDGEVFVAEGYLVHNSAMICLFDDDDSEMLHCKTGDNIVGNEQRWNANNSITINEFKPRRWFNSLVDAMDTSGRGEPGIFSRYAINQTSKRDTGKWSKDDWGTNPCVTGDTWVFTADGARQVTDLIGKPFSAIVDGKVHNSDARGFWKTGIKPTFEIETKEGYSLKATADHLVFTLDDGWKPVGKLEPGDRIKLNHHSNVTWGNIDTSEPGWILGNLVGDGCFTRGSGNKNNIAHLRYWGNEKQVMSDIALNYVKSNLHTRSDMRGFYHPVNTYNSVSCASLAELANKYGITPDNKHETDLIERESSAFIAGYLRGLFDADGTVCGSIKRSVTVRLSQNNYQFLESIQRMLLRLGIRSTLHKERQKAGYKLMPNGKGGLAEYYCNAGHELIISRRSLIVYRDRVGFNSPSKMNRLNNYLNIVTPYKDNWFARVTAVVPAGENEVYDCTIPDIAAFDANGLYVHNCGEIVLKPFQMCNLSSAVCRADDTQDDIRAKVEAAAIIGTIQSLANHFPGLRQEWAENNEADRLLGVDLMGIMDCETIRNPRFLAELNEIAKQTNERIAKKLGINSAAAITCVKPSGNSSVLLDASPGIHARWSKYYIRRVTFVEKNPIRLALAAAGVPMERKIGTANQWVVSFPIKSPDGAIVTDDLPALAQLENWFMFKWHWTDHNPSCTITYRQNELEDIKSWLYENQDFIGGLSFLPRFDAQYEQMPYEAITEERYNTLLAGFPLDVDLSNVSGAVNVAATPACDGDVCELPL